MPRTEEQNRIIRAQSRARLVAAAFDVFAEKGYHDASVADVTARAGVSQGLVSYHFGGKQQLVEAVLEEWLADVERLAHLEGDADERLRAVIELSLDATSNMLPRQRIALSLAVQPSTHHIFAEVEERHAEGLAVAEDALRDIFRERGAGDPVLEAVMLRSLLEGVVAKRSISGESYPLDAARQWILHHYGLGAAPAGSSAAEGRLRATGTAVE